MHSAEIVQGFKLPTWEGSSVIMPCSFSFASLHRQGERHQGLRLCLLDQYLFRVREILYQDSSYVTLRRSCKMHPDFCLCCNDLKHIILSCSQCTDTSLAIELIMASTLSASNLSCLC